MATISHIPNPVAVSVKTAGYTIPANRYARAVVNLIGSATFTINAVTALQGTQATLASTGPTVNRGTDGTSFGSIQAVTGAGIGTHSWSGVTYQETTVKDYFLPAGTIINGTGTWRAVVEEYGG
jgi:hypothetical protein